LKTAEITKRAASRAEGYMNVYCTSPRLTLVNVGNRLKIADEVNSFRYKCTKRRFRIMMATHTIRIGPARVRGNLSSLHPTFLQRSKVPSLVNRCQRYDIWRPRIVNLHFDSIDYSYILLSEDLGWLAGVVYFPFMQKDDLIGESGC